MGDGTGVKPIYEVQMGVKRLPFLDRTPDNFMRHIMAKEVMGKPPVTFQRVEKVRGRAGGAQSNRERGARV